MYENVLPPGFTKPVTLDNLADVLESLQRNESNALTVLSPVIAAPYSIVGVTLDNYDSTFFLNEKAELLSKAVQATTQAALIQRLARLIQQYASLGAA
ncbi:hypothetical protein [Neokomagataea anthophila]|uniref:Uncharacterized protein n=1 Tax=Neokomagataea anthophila TaxID=2826925 RepID=A0ABS5E7Z0_9PROT|nr:hypothetical protein [Neokomagataea anthophila]MBR0560025.1 hypothetical protein [Neokomagataea anthophila]